MRFEWDEDKRLANIAKHGIDFFDARSVWRKPVLDPAGLRVVKQEIRLAALGVLGEDELIVAVVYTVRGKTLRLISARRARRNERKTYQDRFGRGN